MMFVVFSFDARFQNRQEFNVEFVFKHEILSKARKWVIVV